MSRQQGRIGSGSLADRSAFTNRLDRTDLFGVGAVALGTGVFLGRVIALTLLAGSAFSVLWGLLVGLAFAVAGTGVLCLADRAPERRRHTRRRESLTPRLSAGAIGGALVLGLVVAAVV